VPATGLCACDRFAEDGSIVYISFRSVAVLHPPHAATLATAPRWSAQGGGAVRVGGWDDARRRSRTARRDGCRRQGHTS
jgi:hypothetical protein